MLSNSHNAGTILSGRRGALVFLLVVLLLTLGFYRNQWHAAGRKWFYDWKTNSDVMVLARLVWSRQAGVFAAGGLLGLGDGEWPMTPELGAHQYDTYLNGGAFETYWTYNSVIGAQGVVFSLMERLSGFSPGFDLKLFRGLTAALSALAMALIVAWFWQEFGALPAALVLIFCLLSEWLALYAGSLYWQLWAFYLPAGAVTVRVRSAHAAEDLAFAPLAGLVALTVLVKIFVSGFEFITTALAMLFVPVVYYALLRGWRLRAIGGAALKVAAGAAAGTLAGLLVLALQISSVLGGLRPALDYLLVTFGKRAVGDPAQYPGVIAESLRADLGSVIWTYVARGRALDLGNWLGPDLAGLRSTFEIGYFPLFILFAAFSLAFLLFSGSDKASGLYGTTRALLITTWFSMLPPLSWLVFFKAHAYIHANLDYIIWQMPFMFFGFALCGMVTKYFLSLRRAEARVPAHAS